MESRLFRKSAILFTLVAVFLALTAACSSQKNPDNGILTFQDKKYSAPYPYSFQVNSAYFEDYLANGLRKSEYFTSIGTVSRCDVYSIEGLSIDDWVYFPYGDHEQGFTLCKNINTELDSSYFIFDGTIQITQTNYTIDDGVRVVFNETVVDHDVAEYIFQTAEAKGSLTDIGTTFDSNGNELNAYHILLTPVQYSALQYVIYYVETPEGYYVMSNSYETISDGSRALYTEVNSAIHDIISWVR